MRIVNVTPHEIRLRREDGTMLVLPPSGHIARAATQDSVVDSLDGVPVHAVVMSDSVEGLPDPAYGTVYVASLSAAQVAATLGRSDVYTAGPAIRDADGRVVAVELAVPVPRLGTIAITAAPLERWLPPSNADGALIPRQAYTRLN